MLQHSDRDIAATVSALPSTMGSPHPSIPSSVVILRNNQRGGTLNNAIFSIFYILGINTIGQIA